MTVTYNGIDWFTLSYNEETVVISKNFILEIQQFDFETMKPIEKNIYELDDEIYKLSREVDDLEAELENLREELYG